MEIGSIYTTGEDDEHVLKDCKDGVCVLTDTTTLEEHTCHATEFDKWYSKATPKSGWWLIKEERFKQIFSIGHTDKQDDNWPDGMLAGAAIAYTDVARCLLYGSQLHEIGPADEWEFDEKYWKPSEDPVRNLVKAGALIAAEIDKLNRKKYKAE